MYARLFQFLRPHSWRMIGVVACNVGAAVLDVFSFTLLIPFLNALFRQPAIPTGHGVVSEVLAWTVGRLLDPAADRGAPRRAWLGR